MTKPELHLVFSTRQTASGVPSGTAYPLATQAEAEAGTSHESLMTPLRTKQAITANFDVKNVLDLGLSNTGSVNTDQTIAAFLAALTHGNKVLFPPGEYIIDCDEIAINLDNLHIVGDGYVNLKFIRPGKPGIVKKAGPITIEGLTFTYAGPPYLGDDPSSIYRPGLQNQSAILQIQGDDLLVRDCRFFNWRLCIGWHGSQSTTDLSILAKRFIVRDCFAKDFDFVIGARQFDQGEISGLISENTLMRGGAPPHAVYILDRTVARSKGLNIVNCQDKDNPFAGSYKARNVTDLTIVGNRSYHCERGLEIEYCDRVTIVGNQVTGGINDPVDSQRSCIGLRDVSDAVVSNNICEIPVYDPPSGHQRGFFYRSEFDQPARIYSSSNVAIMTWRAGDATGAYTVDDVDNVSFVDDTFINMGDATPVYPFVLLNTTGSKVIRPKLYTPNGATLTNPCVQIRDTCTNTFVEFDPALWNGTATVATAVSDAGIGSILRQTMGYASDLALRALELQATGGGSVTDPSLAIAVDATPAGFYRTSPNTIGVTAGGANPMIWTASRTEVLAQFRPQTDELADLGGTGLYFRRAYMARADFKLLAAPPASVTVGTVALSDGTAGSNSWGSGGAGLYRWNGTAWVFVG